MDPDGDYESLHSARSHGTIFKNAKLDDAEWNGRDEELGLQPSPKINSSKVILAEEKGASIGMGPSALPADDLGCLPSAPPLELLSLHPSPEDDDATAPPTPESSHPPEPPGLKEGDNERGNYIPDSVALPIGLDNADQALPVASVVPIITDATGAEITPPPAQPEVSTRNESDSENAPSPQQSTMHGSCTTQTTADNRAPTRRVPPFFPEATLADLQPPQEGRDKGDGQRCKCTPCKRLMAVAALVIAVIAAVGIGLTHSDGPDDPDGPAINTQNTKYPNCHVAHLGWLNDGTCDGGRYDKEECGWDGGDCLFDKDSDMKCIGSIGSIWTDRTRAWCQNKCMEQGEACEAYDFSGGTCRTFGSYSSTTNKSNSKCFAKQGVQPDIVDSYPTCNVPNRNKINDGKCDGGQYNTEKCGWDGGDCIVEDFPDCHGIHNPHWIGDGTCDGGKYNTRECGWDGGDCLSNANCHVDNPEWIGDGFCNGGGYNTEECRWDGGDCVVEGYPDCHVMRPQWIGDGSCDGGKYNTRECGWDGGDCLSNANCHVDNPEWVGDGFCNGGGYNTVQCAWDGGDCVVDGYPDCHVVRPLKIGDGNCDGGEYNTEECGWDGGDCDNQKKEEYSVAALYPNCNAGNKHWLNDDTCDGSSYNNAECGYDGGDCLFNKNSGKACVGSVRSTWTNKTRRWCQFKCLSEGDFCKAYDFDDNADKCRVFSSYSSKTSKNNSKCYKKK